MSSFFLSHSTDDIGITIGVVRILINKSSRALHGRISCQWEYLGWLHGSFHTNNQTISLTINNLAILEKLRSVPESLALVPEIIRNGFGEKSKPWNKKPVKNTNLQFFVFEHVQTV